MRRKNAFPDFTCGEGGKGILPQKDFQSPDVINMVVGYKDAHDTLHRNINVPQEFPYGSRWYPCIDQNSMEFIPQVIAISAAPAAKAAKSQFHSDLSKVEKQI